MYNFIAGLPGAGDLVQIIPFARSVKLVAGLPNSWGKADTAATATATFSLRKNGVEVGTFAWAASATTPTFSLASDVTYVGGVDYLSVLAPNPQDASLAGVSYSLAGVRV